MTLANGQDIPFEKCMRYSIEYDRVWTKTLKIIMFCWIKFHCLQSAMSYEVAFISKFI